MRRRRMFSARITAENPSYISGREFRRLTYGCTADSKSVGDGWMLRGTDDKGRKVCFRVYIPFETQ